MADTAPQTEHKDPRVAAAISHWAPRFVSNGVLLADFEEVTASVTRWEQWCAAWSARAAIHEGMAIDALAQGFRLSAGEHFTPREVIGLMVSLLFVEDDDALSKPGVVRTIYDPTAGTGGMLSVAEERLTEHNPGARLTMFGQELKGDSA